MASITVINYRAGNLTSVVKSLRAVGAEVAVTESADEVRRATKLVLPGVGHFAATQLLESSGIREAVRARITAGVPFLGICVGMQWLFEGSTEAEDTAGLGFFAGRCDRFPQGVKSPHVGWNSIAVDARSRLFAGVANDAYVYYTHSYRAPVVDDTVAVTDYAGAFSGGVERDNVMGVQFHPEKSGETGLRILKNFVELGGC